MSLIEKLTPEQEALIPVYREKWRKIALSTERIDREKAAEVLNAAYTAIDKQEPEIIFCDSPYAGLKIILKKRKNKLNGNNINLNNNFINYISSDLTDKSLKTSYQLDMQVIRQLTLNVVLTVPITISSNVTFFTNIRESQCGGIVLDVI